MSRKFAIPTLDGKCCAHFGHCQSFAIVEESGGRAADPVFLEPPAHQPGTYPRFLADQGVTVILAGGMGAMAQSLFQENNIEVRMGVPEGDPQTLVQQYLNDELQSGANRCNHGEPDHEPSCGG